MKYKVSTITMSMQIPDCTLNLTNIGEHIEIDDNIIGIKYNSGKESISKGKYLTAIYKKSKTKNEDKINTKLFYNQVSIILQFTHELKERIVNVKLFGNGSLHLTGIKDPVEGYICMFIIYRKLLNLINKYNNILLTLDVNNVYIDNNNNLYSSSINKDGHIIIGYKYYNNKNQVIYNINKKDYEIDTKTGFFIATTFENKRVKRILNLDGIDIGYSKIILLKNKSKLYKNNCNVNIDYINGFIYYDGNEKSLIIGNITYNINLNTNIINSDVINPNILEYNHNCTPFNTNSKIYKINDLKQMTPQELQYDINCINIYFKLDYELNRQRLFNEFVKRKFICEYKPEKYSGIKLRYKVSKIHQNNGLCKCPIKCTCNNITFLIFQSGNIIVIGFKSLEEIDKILTEFEVIIKELEPIIKKKTLLLI